MPKLLRWSETAGCGATIELDNGEVVYVSIAQVSVLVRKWDLHGGFFKSLMSNFFGAKLYTESSVYKNAQTAQALSELFPDQSSDLPRFKNPVLAVFANAIWHCRSAAEVCTVLNEAADKRQTPQTVPKTPQTVDEAMSAYGDLLVKYPIAIMDVSMLPIPKKQMKVLLKGVYAKATRADLKEYIETGFTLLSKFQEGVGPTPIDGRAPFKGKLPTQAEIAHLEKWMAWEKASLAEGEALSGEWKRFLAARRMG